MQGIPQGQQNNSGSQGGGSQKPSLSWQAPPAPATNKLTTVADTPKPSVVSSAPKTDKKNFYSPGEKSNTATYIGIFVAGVIVGILLGWGIASTRSESSPTATSTPQTTKTDTSNTNTGTPAVAGALPAGGVTVAAEQPAGSSVAVSSVSVAKPTWVVVYDNNNGVPGRALGATLFLPTASGGETNGTIDLLRPTVAGTTYLVGQITDDGDYNLSFSKDAAVLDANGKQAVTTLTVK